MVHETRAGDRLRTGLPDVWGARAGEVASRYPCDEHLDPPYTELIRAIDIDAPASVAFRWLCQLKVAPYSYDWIDNLGNRSPRTLTPGADELRIGQRVMVFRLTGFERDGHLTMRELDGRVARVFGEMALTYQVRARPVAETGAATRLIAKLNVRPPAPWGRLRTRWLAWGDLIMMRKQLLTLRDLTEGQGSMIMKDHPSHGANEFS